MRRTDRDRGAAEALGLVLIAPAMIGLAVLVIALGRGVDARAQIRSAAAAAAQAGALERTAADADRAAKAVVAAMLIDHDACIEPDVSTTVSGAPDPDAAVPYGEVRVTIRCTVSGRGLELGLRGDVDEPFTATARVDYFRAGVAP